MVTAQPYPDLLAAQSYARGKVTSILRNYPNDVEDILQDAAMNAIRKLKTFRGESSFNSWYTRIAMNLALMHIRPSFAKRVVKVELDAPMSDGNTMEIAYAGPGPHELYRAGELVERLRKVKLTPKLREELALALMGEGCGVASGRKARRFRLRHELRRQLCVD